MDSISYELGPKGGHLSRNQNTEPSDNQTPNAKIAPRQPFYSFQGGESSALKEEENVPAPRQQFRAQYHFVRNGETSSKPRSKSNLGKFMHVRVDGDKAAKQKMERTVSGNEKQKGDKWPSTMSS
jgi:hypothetical protein